MRGKRVKTAPLEKVPASERSGDQRSYLNPFPRCEPMDLELREWRGSIPGLLLCISSHCGISDKLLSVSYLCFIGEGQKTAETLVTPSPFLSTVQTSHQPREASDFSQTSVTTAISEIILEKNLTAAPLNATGANVMEVEDASIPTSPMSATKAERLQTSITASPGDVMVTQREHHNMSLSVNSSTEIPSPTPTANTLEENQPNHEVTEPFSTTEEMDDASSVTPTPPLNSEPGEVLPSLPVQKVLPQGYTTWRLL